MKRFLMLVAVAAVAGAMYVTAAPGSSSRQAAGPTAKQFTALKKQVAKLQKQVRSTQTDVNFLGAVIGLCMLNQTVGVSQKGDPGGTWGYIYQANQSPNQSYTTALDLSGSPTYTLLTLNPDPNLDCASLVGLGGGLKHFGGLSRLGHH